MIFSLFSQSFCSIQLHILTSLRCLFFYTSLSACTVVGVWLLKHSNWQFNFYAKLSKKTKDNEPLHFPQVLAQICWASLLEQSPLWIAHASSSAIFPQTSFCITTVERNKQENKWLNVQLMSGNIMSQPWALNSLLKGELTHEYIKFKWGWSNKTRE